MTVGRARGVQRPALGRSAFGQPTDATDPLVPVAEERQEMMRLLARLRRDPAWRASEGATKLQQRLAPVFASALEPLPSPRPSTPRRPASTAADVEAREDRSRLARRRAELDQLRRWRIRLGGSAATAAPSMEDIGKHIGSLSGGLPKPTATAAGPSPAAAAPSAPGVTEEEVLSKYSLTGRLESDMMADVLQLLSSNSVTGIFTVQSEAGSFKLYSEDGTFVHAAAEGNGETGESAFFAAFAAERGSYRFEETTELPEERTITGSTQFLILEALRQIDEARGG